MGGKTFGLISSRKLGGQICIKNRLTSETLAVRHCRLHLHKLRNENANSHLAVSVPFLTERKRAQCHISYKTVSE